MIHTINWVKKKYFDFGSVCVTGMRGRGKDMLMANIACRSPAHISNINYGKGYIPLEYDKLDIKNKPDDLVSGNIKPYVYPYPEGVDIFISDIGVYFPAQYFDYLNKKYPTLPMFLALSRQLGLCNIHLNCQFLGRAWDKFREQSDCYILANSCKVIGKLVIQDITIYDRYESALNRAKPFWYPPCRLGASREERRDWRNNRSLAYARFYEQHGEVKQVKLVYLNKSTYDTRYFKSLLRGDDD